MNALGNLLIILAILGIWSIEAGVLSYILSWPVNNPISLMLSVFGILVSLFLVIIGTIVFIGLTDR